MIQAWFSNQLAAVLGIRLLVQHCVYGCISCQVPPGTNGAISLTGTPCMARYLADVTNSLATSRLFCICDWFRAARILCAEPCTIPLDNTGTISSLVGGLFIGVVYWLVTIPEPPAAALKVIGTVPPQWPIVVLAGLGGFVGSMVMMQTWLLTSLYHTAHVRYISLEDDAASCPSIRHPCCWLIL